MPLPVYAGPASERVRGIIANYSASAAVALYWENDELNRRVVASVTNDSGGNWHDQRLTATVPSGVNAGSLTVVEVTADRSIDRAFGWRYGGDGGQVVNRMPYLPSSISGTTVKFIALGKWDNGETRHFAVYWDTTGAFDRYIPPYLGSFHDNWTLTITAGTTGDTYRINIAGTPHQYTQQAGDTATVIAQVLLGLINGNDDAVASGASNVLTINPEAIHDADATFTITNTGSTVPANLVLVSPSWFTVSRLGPDTDRFLAFQQWIRLPLKASGLPAAAGSRAAIVRSTTADMIRLFAYKLNGDATVYGFTTGTITNISWDGPTVTVTGTLAGSTQWSGTYTAVLDNKICKLDHSDGTPSTTMIKIMDLVRVTMTLTCIQAYTPLNDTAAGTTTLNQFVLSPTTTMANKWYATTTTPLTTYTASSATSGLAVANSIVGAHAVTGAQAVLVHSATLSNFSPQTPILKWFGADLQLASTSSASQVPLGATITLDFTYAQAATNSPASTGDQVTGLEMVAILQAYAQPSTVTVSTTEQLSAESFAQTMEHASARCAVGFKWFVDNAVEYATNPDNIAYAANPYTGEVAIPDDADGSYGIGHMVHGLCLRYLRTHDATLIPLIEACMQFHLDIEADAIARYGATLPPPAPPFKTSGCTPYYYNPFNFVFTDEFGFTSQPGAARPYYSIDQMHMVAHGIYAYLYLLRNEPAITANTTLRANILAFLGRMRDDAEPSVTLGATAVFVCGNVYKIATGAAPTNGNGITNTLFNAGNGQTLANPYYGNEECFPKWQRLDTDNVLFRAVSNGAVDDFFRAVYAPNSTRAGVTRYMQGRSNDMLAGDVGHHDIEFPASWGVPGPYPKGWLMREGQGDTKWRFTSGRDGDDHWIRNDSSGAIGRDTLTGRMGQRMTVNCMAALLDPTYMVPVEMTGGTTVVRSVNIVESCNDMARTLALHGADPLTGAERYATPSYGGGAGGVYRRIDIAMNGWWMMGNELWHLVNMGADINDYYPIGLW